MTEEGEVEWVRLKEGNDWMYIYYAIEPLSPGWGTADSSRGGTFEEGTPVHVRTLDGAVHFTTLKLKPYHHTYSDMGSPCSTRGNRVGVELPFAGGKVWLELSQVEVPLGWALARGCK